MNKKKQEDELPNWKSLIALIVGALVVFTIIGWGLHYAGIIGDTYVERKVFENSYQYTAGQKKRIATLEAELAEIEVRLKDPKLDPTTKNNLEAQKRGIQVQLRAAKKED